MKKLEVGEEVRRRIKLDGTYGCNPE